MGKATYDVWPVVRLAAMASVLAANHIGSCAGYKLGTWTGIEIQFLKFKGPSNFLLIKYIMKIVDGVYYDD